MVYYVTEAKFTCTATTDPEEVDNLRIIWKKDDEEIDYRLAGRVSQIIMDNSLTISGAIYLDTGKYTCTATNGIDTDERSANLIVQGYHLKIRIKSFFCFILIKIIQDINL